MSSTWIKPSPGVASEGHHAMIEAHVDHVHGMSAAWPSAAAPAIVALTDAVAIAWDASLGNDFRVTIAGNRTLSNPANPADGQVIKVYVTQDATGPRTLAYDTQFDWGAAGAPVLSTAAGKTDMLEFAYLAALGKWLGLKATLGF